MPPAIAAVSALVEPSKSSRDRSTLNLSMNPNDFANSTGACTTFGGAVGCPKITLSCGPGAGNWGAAVPGGTAPPATRAATAAAVTTVRCHLIPHPQWSAGRSRAADPLRPGLRVPNRAPDPFRPQRQIEVPYAERREGIHDGVCDGGRRRDRPCLADAFRPERVERREGLDEHTVHRRCVRRPRHRILAERRRERLSRLVKH